MLAHSSTQVVDFAVAFLTLSSSHADVDDPLVKLMPLLFFCQFRIHDAL